MHPMTVFLRKDAGTGNGRSSAAPYRDSKGHSPLAAGGFLPHIFLLLLLPLSLATCLPAWADGFGVKREQGVAWLTLPGGPRFFSIGADKIGRAHV